MFIRVIFFVLMALGLVGFGTVAWITTRPPPTTAAAAPISAPSKKMVLSAARPLKVGVLLKPEDLVAKELPEDKLSDGVSIDSPEARRTLAGAMLKRSLAAGEPIQVQDTMRPGEHGFLSAVLEPGARAMTIPVDAAASSAGLVWPGDRVDLILTQSNGDASLPLGRRIGAETVLVNVRVIAIDQQMMQGAGDAQAKTVTLEVNPEQAQRLSVAMRLGHISLAVRSANTDGQAVNAETKGLPTWARDVMPSMLTEALPVPAEPKIRVYQGAGEVREFKF